MSVTSDRTGGGVRTGGPAAGCRSPDPIGLIAEEHALQRELCNLLEALADGLPHSFDKALAVIAVAILERSLPSHTRLEEEALFPRLRERVPPNDPLHAALICLEEEHDRDSATLMEMTDALKTAIATGTVSNPDMLGYMLRGFFESQRRHIAWEDRVVIPAAHTMLTSEDLAEIQKWVMQSDHPRCSRQSFLAIRQARSGVAVCEGCAENTGTSNVLPFSTKSEQGRCSS